MSGLSMFLAQNAQKVENTQFAASKRFVDDNGKPVMWEIKCITSSEDEALRVECTKRIPIPGKRGRYMPELNTNVYLGKMAAKCTAYPDLDSKELQDSYGVMGAESLLKTMLTPGEYAEYLAKVQEINGFDIDLQEEVEEAKN